MRRPNLACFGGRLFHSSYWAVRGIPSDAVTCVSAEWIQLPLWSFRCLSAPYRIIVTKAGNLC